MARSDRSSSLYADLDLGDEVVAPPSLAAGKRTLTSSVIQARGLDPAALGMPPAASTWPGSGGGAPLPEAVRGKMEGAFGQGFGDVRVHQGAEARALGAEAFTQGSDIHFAPGKFDPDSTQGQELIGHELTHVVQQRGGRVEAPAQARGADINADPGLEAEADALGARAARGERVSVHGVGGGKQLKSNAETLAEKLLNSSFDSRLQRMVADACEKLATVAVAESLEAKIRAAAEARAAKEAAKLVSSSTDEGTSRGKAKGGSFKEEAKRAAHLERVAVEQQGSSQDTGQQVERLAYEEAKARGRQAATEAAEEAADEIANEVTDEALKIARRNTANTIQSAVQAKVAGMKGDVVVELTDETVAALGKNPPADVAQVPDGVKMLIGSSLHAETVRRVLADAELVKAAKKAAQRQEKTTKAAVEGEVSAGMQARSGDIKTEAIRGAKEGARDKGDAFRQLRGKVVQKVEANTGLGPKMKAVSSLVETMIPDAGDYVEIDALFSIPVPTAPPFVITIHFAGSAERAGGAGAKNEDMVTLKMELLVGAGGNVGVAKLVGEIGGYVESCGGSAEAAFEQISYAIYRRFRESSAIPAAIPNAIWGMGGSTAKDLGISKDEAKRLEAEEWALGVEQRMIESDREKDDQGNVNPQGGVGTGAYVEGGLKAGVLGDISQGQGKFSAHYMTGRHMRGEGVGDDAQVPSKITKGVFGGKEKRGRGVQAINVKGAIKVGSWATLEAQCVVKWFEKMEGEQDRQVWVTIDGFGKMNLIKADKWVAFGFSAAHGLANLLAIARQAYDKANDEEGPHTGARTTGATLGAFASVESMVSEAAGNASALVPNSLNSLGSEATEFGMGSQTTVRLAFDYRGSASKAFTIMLYQAKALDVNVEVAQVQAAAHKRLVQLTLLPSPRIEIPGFDLSGD